MATIIISVTLLVLVLEEGFAGWHARFTVLETQAKEQANALAEGCADQALTMLLTNPVYGGTISTTFPTGTCSIFPPDYTTYPGRVVVRVQARVPAGKGGALVYTNLTETSDISCIHVGTSGILPACSGSTTSVPLTSTRRSWQEIPTNE